MADWHQHRNHCRDVDIDNGFSYSTLKSGLQSQYGPAYGYDFEMMRHIGVGAAKATGNKGTLYFDFSVPHKLLPPVPRTATVMVNGEVSIVVL